MIIKLTPEKNSILIMNEEGTGTGFSIKYMELEEIINRIEFEVNRILKNEKDK